MTKYPLISYNRSLFLIELVYEFFINDNLTGKIPTGGYFWGHKFNC